MTESDNLPEREYITREYLDGKILKLVEDMRNNDEVTEIYSPGDALSKIGSEIINSHYRNVVRLQTIFEVYEEIFGGLPPSYQKAKEKCESAINKLDKVRRDSSNILFNLEKIIKNPNSDDVVGGKD